MTRLERYKQNLIEAASKPDQSKHYHDYQSWERDAVKLGYNIHHRTHSDGQQVTGAHKAERDDHKQGYENLRDPHGRPLGAPFNRGRGTYWHPHKGAPGFGYMRYKYMKEDGGAVMSSGNGGFSGASAAAGPTAGFDPVMGFKNRIKKSAKKGLGVSADKSAGPSVGPMT